MGSQQNAPLQEKKADWEQAIEKLAQHTTAFMEETRANFKNHGASIRNLELQMSQLSKQISNLERSHDTLPGDTIPNPKEHCNAITLRSGRIVQQKEELREEGEKEKEKEEELKNEKYESEKKLEREKNREKKRKEEMSKWEKLKDNPYARIPYPGRLMKQEKEREFARFLDVFKKLHINIPFAKALEKMPSYAKFVKELLSKKRRLEEDKTVPLTE